MREPIVTMCLTLEAARRIDRLKECADEYLPFWLLEAVQSTQPMLDYGTASGGLSLLRWYSACGLTPDKAREVLASMQSVAALLEPRVRPDVWAASGARWMRDMENRAGGSRDRARK